MSRRELGSLVLVSFLLVGGFYYAKFSYLNSPDSRALLAQTATGASESSAPAPSSSSSSGVDEMCIGGETLSINVAAAGLKPTRTCNLPANTCKVTITTPEETAQVKYCCNPKTGACSCVDKNVDCNNSSPSWKLSPTDVPACKKNFTPIQIPKTSGINPASQVAAAASARDINCDELNGLKKKFSSASPTSPTSAQNPAPPISPTSATNPAPPSAQTPAATVPQSRDNLSQAYQTGAPTQTAGQPSTPNSYAQIQEAGRAGSAPGQTTFPGQTQAAPGGPAFDQGGFYRPGTNPSGELSGSTRGGYYSPLSRTQSTFGGTGFSSRSSSRVAASFISGIASLIGGLFSVPTNNVVNYVQSFVGAAPQQASANQNSGQPQNYAYTPGQVVVIVPYPMPTSRKGDALAQLPPPPTSANDAYAELRALANQANGNSDELFSPGVQEDRITSAFTGQDEQTQTGTTPSEHANSKSSSGSIPAERGSGLLESGLQMSTTAVPVTESEATSTHATTTSYKEPKVVEVGIPVDITDLGSYEAVLAYLKGDWARTEHAALQNKVALAQAESQQDAIRAQIEALQDARAADLCDDSCAASLTVLQNELPVLQSRVGELQTAIEKDAAPHPASPPPTVAQIHRVVESLAEPTYKATIPRSAAESPTAMSVYEQKALPEVPQSKSEAIVTRVVESIWNFLKSIFLTPATEAAKPRPSCSLFASLFGKCK